MNAPPSTPMIEDERAPLSSAPLSISSRENDPPAPVVFASREGPIFGFHHTPRTPISRASTVILCPPIGYESMLTHRTYRHLAERLAALGFHVLRFDYHGTGDSSGRQHDAGRVNAWLDSIDVAIDNLRAWTGIAQVTLFGVRTGGLFAAAAADRRTDVSTLVLYAPGANGRGYVREFRAFSSVKNIAPAGDDAAQDKDEVVAGYFLSGQTLRDLAEINLITKSFAGVKRALVIGRDDLPGTEPRLAAHLTTHGVQAENPAVAGYAGMMRDAEFSTVPDAFLGFVVDWLVTAHAPALPTNGDARNGSPSQPPLLGRPPHVASGPLATKSRAGVPVEDRAVAYDLAGRLFGVLSRPVEPTFQRARTAVLFLNVGSNHHIGPHRMYVALSRELAAIGFTAFRFDVAGLGDSRPHPGKKENILYARDSIGDVQRAISYLAETAGAERFVVFGICSGAYLAFHTTVVEPRISAQILVNPQTFQWREGDSLELKIKKESYKATRFYRQAVLKKETWQRLYRQEINLRGIADELYDRSREKLAARVTRALAWPGEVDHVAESFAKISDRSTSSLLIYSGNDGGIDVIEAHLGSGGGRMRKRKNFHFEIIDGADHTITPLASQETLERMLIDYMVRHFG